MTAEQDNAMGEAIGCGIGCLIIAAGVAVVLVVLGLWLIWKLIT